MRRIIIRLRSLNSYSCSPYWPHIKLNTVENSYSLRRDTYGSHSAMTRILSFIHPPDLSLRYIFSLLVFAAYLANKFLIKLFIVTQHRSHYAKHLTANRNNSYLLAAILSGLYSFIKFSHTFAFAYYLPCALA